MLDYLRLPKYTNLCSVSEKSVFLDVLLSAAVDPLVLVSDSIPIGRGEVLTTVAALAVQVGLSQSAVRAALAKLCARGLIRHDRECGGLIIDVLHFTRYLPIVCDSPDTVRLYRHITDKPWYRNVGVKSVYLYLLQHADEKLQSCIKHISWPSRGAVSSSFEEMRQGCGVGKKAILVALKWLKQSGDIRYIATDKRCEVVLRDNAVSNVIEVDFTQRKRFGME